MPPLRFPVGRPVAEALAAAILLGGTGLVGVRAARAYDVYLRPAARSVPTATPTPYVDPAVARENARRQRLASDHVGAGIALRQLNPRAAIDEFMQALAIDRATPTRARIWPRWGWRPPASSLPRLSRPPSVVSLVLHRRLRLRTDRLRRHAPDGPIVEPAPDQVSRPGE